MKSEAKQKVNRKKKAINLTLSDGVKQMAAELMGNVYANPTALIEHLIIRKHEEVYGVTKHAAPETDASPQEKTIAASMKKELAKPTDPTDSADPHQVGIPQNSTGGTTKREGGKKKRAQKPQ